MPLTSLNLNQTKVTDKSLAQIKDCMDLSLLILSGTNVSVAGLAHLKTLKNLKRLDIQGTNVSDLSAVADMPLDEIRLTAKNITKKGLDVLRKKSLKTIGIEWNQAWPAAEFWARYDKGEFNK
jgi:Leucine-rich repeat (LRR) protein